MTYEQYQFILRLSKMVEDYQKEFKDFKLKFEEHIKENEPAQKIELPKLDDFIKPVS